MKPFPQLSSDSVLIIHALLTDFPSHDELLLNRDILDDWEKIKYDSYKVDFKKKEFFVARLIAKSVLSSYLNSPIKNLVFFEAKNGKLYLVGDTTYHFNISHTKQQVAIAVSNGFEVGIDTEIVEENSDIRGIATRYFSGEETEYLEKQAFENHVAEFYKIWTLKEAYLKAVGAGLAQSLQSFSIPIDDLQIELNGYSLYTGTWNNCPFSVAIKNPLGIAFQILSLSVSYEDIVE